MRPPIRGRCWSKPMGSASSTPATCAPTGAPASVSISSSPTNALAASTGCSARVPPWGRRAGPWSVERGRRRGAAPRARPREPGEAHCRRRLRPEPLPPRELLPGGAPAARQLVVDAYQAYVLLQLTPLSRTIPQVSWDGVRVKFAHHQVERLKEAGLMDLAREMSARGRVSTEELVAEPGRFLMCIRGSYGVTKLFDRIGPERVVLVWSLWRGYWKRSQGLRS